MRTIAINEDQNIDTSDDTYSVLAACKRASKDWWSFSSISLQRYREDLFFSHGYQWDSQVMAEYNEKNKPMMTLDKITPNILKISAEERRGELYTEMIPISADIDQTNIDLITEIHKNILYNSQAKSKFSSIYENDARAGIGAVQLYIDYESEKSFLQQLFIKEIDPLSSFWDPLDDNPYFVSGEFCGNDIIMSEEKFKALYPGKEFTKGLHLMSEYSPYYVRDSTMNITNVVNFWRRERKPVTLVQLTNGMNFKEDCYERDINLVKQKYYKMYLESGYSMDMVPTLYESNRRKTTEDIIMGYELSNTQILSAAEWKSKYLPNYFFSSSAKIILGKLDIRSYTNRAKNAQQMYNFTQSEKVASLKGSRRTQILATPAQIEGHEEEWKNINEINGALPYNVDPLAGAPPFAIPNPEISQSFFAVSREADEDIQKVMGMTDPVTGELPDGTSGVALDRMTSQQNLSSISGIDKLHGLIQNMGMSILELLPYVYDSERDFVINSGNHPRTVKLNAQLENGKIDNDMKELTKIVKEFRVSGTASYRLQSIQGIESLKNLIQLYPPAAPLLLEQLAKLQDTPLKNEIVKILGKYVTPPYVAQDQPMPPSPPNPEIQLKQMEMQLKQQELQLKQQELQTKTHSDQINTVLNHIQEMQKIQAQKLDSLLKLKTQQLKSKSEIGKALITKKS